MNMDTIIETKNLTKKFGNFTANDHIDLAVKEGEIRAIIGENGAGIVYQLLLYEHRHLLSIHSFLDTAVNHL